MTKGGFVVQEPCEFLDNGECLFCKNRISGKEMQKQIKIMHCYSRDILDPCYYILEERALQRRKNQERKARETMSPEEFEKFIKNRNEREKEAGERHRRREYMEEHFPLYNLFLAVLVLVQWILLFLRIKYGWESDVFFRCLKYNVITTVIDTVCIALTALKNDSLACITVSTIFAILGFYIGCAIIIGEILG